MNKNTTGKIIISSLLLLALSGALLCAANFIPGFAHWYSVTIYDVLVNTVGRFFGIFPFSIVEILLYLMLAGIVICLFHLTSQILRKKDYRIFAQRFLTGIVLAAALLFFLFAVNCGVNYHRDSFAESAGLEIEAYTAEELAAVCRILTEDVNRLAELVSRDENGIMIFASDREVQTGAVNAMTKLAQRYSELEGFYPRPKELIFPWILSVQKITGIYSPFTIEANYNSGVVDYNIPFCACHELSHLRGFMQEEEANFIAYLACMESDLTEFRYSGSLLGWLYCTNALYKADIELWAQVRGDIHELANLDLQANSEYWDQYDSQIADMADRVNDNYLKANGQSEGVKSYGKMVDLMMAYYMDSVVE